MSQASKKLMDIVICMPDTWHDFPPYYKTKYGIGQAYERLPQETKDILKDLKSDDIKNAPWWVGGSRKDYHVQSQKKEISDLKLKFDRAILKKIF